MEGSSNFSSLPAPAAAVYWTREQDKQFENLLADVPEEYPNRFEWIKFLLPFSKTLAQVLQRYQDLVADVEAVEAGLVPLPNYTDDVDPQEVKNEANVVENAPKRRRRKQNPQCRWTEAEHKLFLEGLEELGKGDWRGISRMYVRTKSPAQVASHAQRHFLRHSNDGKNNVRTKNSIHDVTRSPLPNGQVQQPVSAVPLQAILDSPAREKGSVGNFEFEGGRKRFVSN